MTRGHSTHLLASDIEIQDVSSSNVRKSKNWVTENGSPINVAGQTELSLQIGKLLIKAVFKIARDLSQDIIIGVYILKPNGCILDFKTNELRIGNTCLKIQIIEPNKTTFLHATHSVTIKPIEYYFLFQRRKPISQC